MAFPATPLSVKVELQNIVSAGVWTDVTSYVYDREGQGIRISRGRQNEGGTADPGSCSFLLNNRDGRFSPRNPTGPYYGRIGRNTPVRVSALVGPTRLLIPGLSDSMSAPDTAGLSITGDLDIRADVRLPNWGPNVSTRNLIQKFGNGAGLRSYRLLITQNARIQLEWSADGTSSIVISSTASLPSTTGRQTVRATLDVDNGAGGNTVTFYYGPSTSGPWTQLGTPVVTAGVTSIFDSAQAIFVSGSATAAAEFYAIEVRQGINGTVRANPNFTTQAEGATSFVDGAGNTWTINNAASLTARRYRFYGEVSSWPQAWDLSGKDVWTSIEASGVLRRLNQSSDPLKSSIQRFVTRNASPAYAYWPMDDAEGSTSLASGLASGPAMTFAGTPNLSTDTTFVSSNALPTLGGAVFTGYLKPMAATGTIYAQMLLSVPAAGEANDGVFLRVFTTGTAARWDVSYVTSTDQLRLDAYDSDNVSLLSALTYSPNGKPLSMILHLVQNGANIDYGLYLNGYVNPTPGLGPLSGTLASRTTGVATAVQINPSRLLTDSTVGHLYVFAAAQNGSLAEINALRGNVGESAGRRVERLCGEEGITFTAYGDLDQTVAMGPQRPLPLVDLLTECEVADLGQIFESRDSLGIAYRTRDSRQYGPAVLALSYGNLAELSPVEDDQSTRNDVTVTRSFGSSARATVDSGALSTQAPPDGVGRYADSIEVNLYDETQLADQAQWRVTAGTVDEARYPDITVQLESPPFSASSSLTDQALSVECGDLVTVSGLPAWLPPDTVRQHTTGVVESLDAFEYGISFVCVPSTPYGSTGSYDDGVARYAAGNSVLNGAITSTALSAVSLTSPPVWTNNVADFPLDIMIEGERITVSAISGATTTQTWTFSARSVNGVVKAHPSGALIELADPDYYSL